MPSSPRDTSSPPRTLNPDGSTMGEDQTKAVGGAGTPERRPVPPGIWLIAGLFLVLHLLPRPGYGFHRDELLYLAMADHLDLLRMQFPPLIAVLGRLAKTLPLDTLTAIHLLAALTGTAVLGMGVAITRRLGGGRHAQVLAAVALAVGPFSLRTGALFQPVVFEVLWWSLADRAVAHLRESGGTESPNSLYRGKLGVAVIVADLERPEEATMPFFEPEDWV